MTPFLHHIAQTFYSEYGNELYKHTFVFPNKRAGVFFQKYLAEIAGKPVFSPKIITIQELFQSLSKYRIADKIEMLVMLYGQFTETGKSDELFDDFVYWGEMLLNDFNDVDKHMVDAKQLFRNIPKPGGFQTLHLILNQTLPPMSTEYMIDPIYRGNILRRTIPRSQIITFINMKDRVV